jgi:MerR family copper efflux transcriptional regulator
MLIAELATRAGVTQKAVRYYERRGLLTPQRTEARYRNFDEHDLTVVQSIRRGQNLGTQLEELREVIDLINHGSPPCQAVRALLAAKRADVVRRIKEHRDFDEMLAKLETLEGTSDPQECTILKGADHGHAPQTKRYRGSR